MYHYLSPPARVLYPTCRGDVIIMLICRPYITVKGRRIFAKDVGKKAFCWEVTPEEHQEYLKKKAKEKK
jgi:hypothetical protein